MSTQGNKTAALNTVIQPAVIPSRMNFNPKKSDPIPMTEKMDLSASPNIKNNGEALYSFGTFSIVDAYETNEEKQRHENEDRGYGAITDVEMYIVMECTFDDYNEEDWYYEEEIDYDYYYPDSYIEMLESGEMIDENGMCKMNPNAGLMGDSLTGLETTDELIAKAAKESAYEESEPDAETEIEASADGPTAEGETTPTAEAEADEPAATTATATPSTEPAIESSINLTSQFSEATSPPATTAPRAAPENVAPRPTEAANAATYQMSA